MMKIKQGATGARAQSGFTLIEIMVVVIIIGLLSAMIVPNLFGQQHKAFVIKAKNDISSISSQLSMYRLDNFQYPTTSEGLQALATNPGKSTWSGPYMEKNKLPKDPWKNEYQYANPGTHNPNGFDLWSFGADGVPGGEGNGKDIGNWDEE
ncbi:type II secretion system major pseudopilin GspG [Arenicella xantha]|uniref:Type II secretion system core protein G n=1 Tax=Arenicella xantha TaxID=644221 RepID=A0A395JL84_9GAMM|nr:type II secretion system major pseudopilin GspG [Arenicella xantha]RBP51359.1 type II secretion system protein G (GspG) [Arenicella xantha]